MPVLDLGPGLTGSVSPDARFFLVVERNISSCSERCAIPVQGECELVAGILLPPAVQDDYVIGCLDLNEERIDVLDLEKAIAAVARVKEETPLAAEVLS